MADAFSASFGFVVGHEGGFSDEPDDPGNWTLGRVGSGDLHGTKFGISAGSYPALNIAELTLDDAQAIYRRDYWARVGGDALTPRFALLVFDAAVNNGVGMAIRWLQTSVGSVVDGELGPRTMACYAAAVHGDGLSVVCAEFQSQRMNFMANLPAWRRFGLGWARRLCTLPYQSMTMADS